MDREIEKRYGLWLPLLLGVAMWGIIISIAWVVLGDDFYESCESRFREGGRIAHVCKYIDGKVKLLPESDFTDDWQHPKDTLKLGTGDCEDVVLLFSYLTRYSYVPAIYCWGECQDENGNTFAHTWIEIESKDQQTYVIEFFGNDSDNMIFPITEDKWKRHRHVMLAHMAFQKMAREGFVRQKNVFNKLHEVFFQKQKGDK